MQVPLPPPSEFTPVPELTPETPAPELAAAPEPVPLPPRLPTPQPVATAPPAAAPARVATPLPAAAPARVATPLPAAAPARVATPLPMAFEASPADIPDLTDEIDPVPAPAVWKQGHPSARKWAERRQGGGAATRRRAPSLPRIVLGILIAALGAWLVLSFLPDRKPLTAAERARVEKQAGLDSNAWRFDEVGYMAARGGAALYFTIGILVALRGLFYRRRIETPCRRCGRTVMAERSGLGLRCEGGPHSAGVNSSALALVICFVALSLGLAALMALASLR